VRVSGLLDKKPETEDAIGGVPAVLDIDNSRITGAEPPDNFAIAARDESGRFVKGASGSPALRFKKGRSGNPKGRPKGSGRFPSGARVAAALLDGEAERITRTAIDAALAGDAVAARFCLGRVLGSRRGQPVELALPKIAAPRDLSGAVAAITAALADGRLTPDEAQACSRMLDGLPRVLAAARADAVRYQADTKQGDPRERLIAELDRLAERETLRQSRALATIPAPPRRLDIAVTEQQEQHQDHQQQAAEADAAAIAIA
jgi:hypothetical protein